MLPPGGAPCPGGTPTPVLGDALLEGMLLCRGQPIPGDAPAPGDTHQGDSSLWGPSHPALQPPACDIGGRGTLGAASCHAAHNLKIVSSSRALGLDSSFLWQPQCSHKLVPDGFSGHRAWLSPPQMAGSIFSPLGSCSELEKANCHPLVCLLCHEPYQHPCLLDCYHNFCASCLRGRASDGRLRCPLCG